jgi:hypothetical protein
VLKIEVSVISISVFYFLGLIDSWAIEPVPCCPPGTSAVSRAIAQKLLAIKSSPGYHMMQLIVGLLVLFFILVLCMVFLVKRNYKKGKKN